MRLTTLCRASPRSLNLLAVICLCIASITSIRVRDAESQVTGIAFVQANWVSQSSASTSVAVSYPLAQTAGNLNVVVVTWNDTAAQVQAVTDTTGNTYLRAIGPTVRSTTASQSIYYAINKSTTVANTVTATFTAAATTPEVRAAEYFGIDQFQPLDITVGGSGNSTSSSSGSVTTRNASDLLVGANWASNTTTGAGSLYASRLITAGGDILEDRVVTAAGSYSATAPVSPSGTWIMQLAAFRAAGSPESDLTITKTHTGSFTQGQTGAKYSLTVANSGTWATTGTVTVSDTLPSGLTATALSGSGWTCVLSTVTCTRSSALAAGSSYPVITLTVTVAANAPASVTNSATVAGGGEANTANDVASDVTTITPPIPDLTLTKTHSGSFRQGQTGATYTLRVQNGGTGSTSGTVTVRDTLPAGLTATGLSGSGWSCTLATLTCTRSSTLAAGSSYSTITLTVSVSATAPASLTNTATVSGGGEVNTANDSASDPTTITQVADLTVSKTHVGTFGQGQVGATYSITVSNTGNGATSGTVTMADTLPSGLTATAISGAGWTCTQPAGPCSRSDALAAGGSFPSIILTVSVAQTAPGTVTNTATVSGGGEINTANDSANDVTQITSGTPDLSLAKTHAGTFSQGQSGASYTLAVSNVGVGPTSGLVTVSDNVPAGLTAVAMSGAGWTCAQPSGPCTRSDSLPAGSAYASLTLTVNVGGDALASVTNTATVSAAGDANAANNTATDVTAIVQLPDMTVGLSHTGTFAQGQSGATYTITATNAGHSVSSGSVTVTDTLPTGLTATSLVGAGWSCLLNALTCTRADGLAPATAYPVIVLTVGIDSAAPSSVTNAVTIAGGGEINSTNDNAVDVTPIVAVPDLVVTSTHVGAFAQGETGAKYTLTVSNTGSTSTSGVVTVSDVLASGVNPTALSGAGWNCDLNTITCSRSDVLAPGAQFPSIGVVANVAADAAAAVTNVATVSGGGEFNGTNDTANDATTITPPPDLTASSSHVGSFAVGLVGATYTLAVTNIGPGVSSGVVTLSDTLPPPLTATAIAGTGWTCVLATLSCTRNDSVGAGGSYPPVLLTLNVPINAPATLTNSVVVSGGGEFNTDNDTATDVTNITPPPDLMITKAHLGLFSQGQRGAPYMLTVSNVGGGPTAGIVSVTDTLPGGLTATGIAGVGWNCVTATLTCVRSDVLAAAGNYPAITLTVDVANNAPASLVNTATVTTSGDVNSANNAAADLTAVTQVPDLTLSVTDGGTFTQGQAGATYTLTVTNVGAASTAGMVVVTDVLPAAVTATALDGAGWTCDVPSLACTRSDGLPPGASYPSIVLTVNVAANAPASVTNSASVSGGGEANTSNDAGSDTTAVVQLPDLQPAVTHTGSFVQGQTGAVYAIVVSNVGPGPTVGAVTVADTLPAAGMTATAMSGNGWNCTLTPLSCTRSDSLPAGGSYPTVTLVVTVSADAPAGVTNAVAVSVGGDSNAANNTASDLTAITPPADLTIAKTHAGSFAQNQVGATYTITVTNVGAAPSAGTVTIVDTLPSSLIATSMAGAGWTCALGNLTCTRSDTLAAGASFPAVMVSVNVSSRAPSTVTNIATVGGGGELNTANDSASDVTTIGPAVNPPPTLVQHVAGGMDDNYATTLTTTLPNPGGAGNTLILGVRFNSIGSVASVLDDKGNTWLSGPTTTNASAFIGTTMRLYYAPNIAAGTQRITVTFSGLAGPSGAPAFVQALVSEFYNVAAVSPLDGNRSNATSTTTGSFTTTAPGDLIYEWGTDVSAVDYNEGIQFNGSSITAGPGFTLLSADLQTGSADQYMVQASAGAVNPTFVASGADTWSSLAIALKSAPAGTPPPLGIRIIHMQHSMVGWPNYPGPVTMAFPSSGNLLVASMASEGAFIQNVTDSNNNVWLSAAHSTGNLVFGDPESSTQIVFAASATTSPDLTNIRLALNPGCPTDHCNIILYDVIGATASPFDKASNAVGNQLNSSPVTMDSLTPSANNELVFEIGAIDFHTINSVIGAGYVLDAQVNGFDDNNPGVGTGTAPSRLDQDNAFAHIYTTTVSPVAFTFTANIRTSPPAGIAYWGSVAVAFFGIPPVPDTQPPTIPTNLTAAGVSSSQINLSWAASADNVGVTGYQVFRGASKIGTSASTSFVDSGLPPQTTFTYTVAAFDAAGNVSAQSATATASTTYLDVTPPSVPANLQASNVTPTTATITWSSSTDDVGVAGYRVFRNGVLAVTTVATTFGDVGLIGSTTYSYNVAAFDASGNVSPQSTPLNVTTAAPPPSPPAFIKLKEAAVASSSSTASTGSFAAPVTTGNLIVVWVWYNSTTQKVASVGDTAGNVYALAVGPTSGTGGTAGWREELWYATNVNGGANLNVTATFTGSFNAEKSISAHEYSGLDRTAPLDATAAGVTSTANASTGSVTTKFANELVFAVALFQGSGSAGSGFTQRSSIGSNASEDRIVSSAGSYSGVFTNAAQAAIVQMVTFKAAGQ